MNGNGRYAHSRIGPSTQKVLQRLEMCLDSILGVSDPMWYGANDIADSVWFRAERVDVYPALVSALCLSTEE